MKKTTILLVLLISCTKQTQNVSTQNLSNSVTAQTTGDIIKACMYQNVTHLVTFAVHHVGSNDVVLGVYDNANNELLLSKQVIENGRQQKDFTFSETQRCDVYYKLTSNNVLLDSMFATCQTCK